MLQFIFLSDGGFRFPIAQFPSSSCTATDLFHLLWEGVLKLLETGFNVYWCILDGAEVNRQFVKLHFQGEDDAVEKNFTAQNPYTGEPFVFMMDSKVVNIKKKQLSVLSCNTSIKFYESKCPLSSHKNNYNLNNSPQCIKRMPLPSYTVIFYYLLQHLKNSVVLLAKCGSMPNFNH